MAPCSHVVLTTGEIMNGQQLLKEVSTILQFYRGDQCYWWWKPEYPGKTTALSQVTDKFIEYTLP